jgi:arylsulfatase I/J
MSKEQELGKSQDGITPTGEVFKRRDLLLGGASLAAASVLFARGLADSAHAQQTNSPNIVIILADNLGNADLGYHGSACGGPLSSMSKSGSKIVLPWAPRKAG